MIGQSIKQQVQLGFAEKPLFCRRPDGSRIHKTIAMRFRSRDIVIDCKVMILALATAKSNHLEKIDNRARVEQCQSRAVQYHQRVESRAMSTVPHFDNITRMPAE